MARHVDDFLASVPRLTRVVTAAELIEARLLDWGVPREKLIRIPIGVDTDLFRPANAAERKVARTRYAIPDEALVIGSFQKDGVGWGEGNKPKLIKGPDVFLDVVDRVARKRPVFVLLTGPARGFVKRGLRPAPHSLCARLCRGLSDAAAALCRARHLPQSVAERGARRESWRAWQPALQWCRRASAWHRKWFDPEEPDELGDQTMSSGLRRPFWKPGSRARSVNGS